MEWQQCVYLPTYIVISLTEAQCLDVSLSEKHTNRKTTKHINNNSRGHRQEDAAEQLLIVLIIQLMMIMMMIVIVITIIVSLILLVAMTSTGGCCGTNNVSSDQAFGKPATLAPTSEPGLHPVSVRRFPSFRTQPLTNLSRYL